MPHRQLGNLAAAGFAGLIAAGCATQPAAPSDPAAACNALMVTIPALGIDPPSPDEMIGSLAAFPLPDATGHARNPWYQDALHERLFEEEKIEVPIYPFPNYPRRLLRIAAQAYNAVAEYQTLADAVAKRLC